MTDWSSITRDVAAGLRALDDDGFLTLSGTARGEAGPVELPRRPGLLGRLRARSGPEAKELFVQFRRNGTHLYAECVGGPQVGGRFPWSDEEHEALLATGWQPPPGIGAAVYVRFFPEGGTSAPDTYLAGDLAEQAVDLAVRTLRDVAQEATTGGVQLTSG